MRKLLKIIGLSIGVLLFSLLLFVAGVFAYYEWFWQEWSPRRIERITGVRIPKYKIIEYQHGKSGFTRDYEDKYIIEFNSMPSNELFDEIDKITENKETCWKKNGLEYSFSIMWGNGYPAPPGVSEEDGMFSITITRGEKVGMITSGA